MEYSFRKYVMEMELIRDKSTVYSMKTSFLVAYFYFEFKLIMRNKKLVKKYRIIDNSITPDPKYQQHP